MKKIASFKRNHEKIKAGLYLQETKRNVDVYDLRFVKPNTKAIPIKAVHSIEHMFATFLKSRKSKINKSVISFCVGGCQTMFYLEVFHEITQEDVKNAILKCIDWCLKQDVVVGATKKECGNYKSHNLKQAKKWLIKYQQALKEE